LADEIQTALRRHVVDAWFPRCFDTQYGGYLCDFDQAWRQAGPQQKLLEFQARQLLTAAEACLLWPQDALLQDAVARGIAFLRGPMWDDVAGGWFHRTDREGRPLAQRCKHVHGAAYAIQACCAVYEATGDDAARTLALEGFAWMEAHARDAEHGGYWGLLSQANRPITEPAAWPQRTDPIGTPIGWKDVNVHSDLLEALGCLHRAQPTPAVTQSLEALAALFCQRLLPAGPDLCFYYQADWRPVAGIVSFGYEFQTVFRLLQLRAQLQATSPAVIETLTRALMDRALATAWDGPAHGCRAYAVPDDLPPWFSPLAAQATRRPWWVQTEMLKAALAMSRLEPDAAIYRQSFEAQWRWIRDRLLDPVHGGCTTEPASDWPAWRALGRQRSQRAAALRKGSEWKDASHDGRAMVYAVRALRGDIHRS